jgi:hypothetical protein
MHELGIMTPAIFQYCSSVGYAGLLFVFFHPSYLSCRQKPTTTSGGVGASARPHNGQNVNERGSAVAWFFVGYFAWSGESILSSVYHAVPRLLHGLGPRVWYLVFFSIECIGRLLRYQRRFRSMKLPPATKARVLWEFLRTRSQEIDVSYSNTLLRDAHSSDVFNVRLQITQFDGSLMRRDMNHTTSSRQSCE